ncbi:hypothetical protein AJ80_04051 [Polytolypa hystricis UAMH7299]|uniref:Translation machinery-associated protein 16 n=1 Tax=Polytolypa hystricis (strain UAMH7299) TaxID=1447883 RepID=A0A2B7YEG3_POLH7|nr:hypothetical protein AJ80_04051 [Polytolypa hystricis UAMH7299]
MVKNLYKVQKKISRKRGKVEGLHEHSRDAKALRKASGREDKLARAASGMSRERQSFVDRVSFFQAAIGDDLRILSDDDMIELITRYLSRFNEELEQLQQEQRKGRPPSKREEVISQKRDLEAKEFATGLWLPDMGQEDNVKRLKAWNRDWSAMSAIAFIRLSSERAKKPSSFPPKALS